MQEIHQLGIHLVPKWACARWVQSHDNHMIQHLLHDIIHLQGYDEQKVTSSNKINLRLLQETCNMTSHDSHMTIRPHLNRVILELLDKEWACQ